MLQPHDILKAEHGSFPGAKLKHRVFYFIRKLGLIRRVHGNQGDAALQFRSGEYVGINVIGKRPYPVVPLSQKGNVDDILTLLAEVLDDPGLSQTSVS